MKTEVRLTCPCGEKFTRGELSPEKAAQVTQLWDMVHDGALCFVSRTADKFWRDLKSILPTTKRGGK